MATHGYYHRTTVPHPVGYCLNNMHVHYIIANEAPMKPRRGDSLLYDLAEGAWSKLTCGG